MNGHYFWEYSCSVYLFNLLQQIVNNRFFESVILGQVKKNFRNELNFYI